jgi:hypothetical protein
MDARTTDDDPLLIGSEEAALVGRSQASVSRARQQPSHPVNTSGLPPKTLGLHTHPVARRSDILTWWQQRGVRRPGPRRRHLPTPDGWTRSQWQALQTIHAGGEITAQMLEILTRKGALTKAGRLTMHGRDLLDTATDGATTHQEQQ